MTRSDQITLAQYHQHRQSYESQGRYVDLIDGQLIEISLFSRLQSHIITQLFARLNYHVDTHLGGAVFDLKQGYVLDNQTVLHPTLSYVSQDRMSQQASEMFDGTANIAIYVVDERDTTVSIQSRVHLHLNHAAEMVWVIFADESCAELYTLDKGELQVDELGLGDTLVAPNILPEFELPLFTIFPAKRMS